MYKRNKRSKPFSLLILSLMFVIYLLVSHNGNTNIKAQTINSNKVDYLTQNQSDELSRGEMSPSKVVISSDQEQKQEKLNKLQNDVETYLGDNIKNVGLSYYDISSGLHMEIGGDKTYLAGSTVKVQMNMVLCDLFQNGQVSKNETVKYTTESYEEGTGVLQDTDLQNPLPITLLSEYSITHSDNIATNMIIGRIGYENMRNSVDTKLEHATDQSNNFITPNDETKLLRILYENTAENPYYSDIIENMKNTDFHDRLDLYIPKEIVAHKIGDYSNYVNDVGIVYSKEPYIISLYTNELMNANQVIANISKMIYDYQCKM